MTLNGLKILLNLIKALQKVMKKKVMKGIFFTLMFILNNLHNDLRFLPERMKIINFGI